MQAFRIVRQSEGWVVFDKPAGFHTHPPEDKKIRLSHRWSGLAIAERQLGLPLFPVHRLDRATSGLLLFSKKRSLNANLQSQFAEGSVKKSYFALVRGRLEGNAWIERALTTAAGKEQEARTMVQACYHFSLPLAHPRGGDRQFTVVEARPLTGRTHQIRRHLAGLGLPLIGDSQHGDRKLNREFQSLTGLQILFLRCMALEFIDPEGGLPVQVEAQWNRHWQKLFDRSGCCALRSLSH